MSNKRRAKRLRQHRQVAGWELAQVFFGVGAEQLTPALIAELVGRGWPQVDLEKFGRRGALYSRIRDSLIFPAGSGV